MRAKIEESQCSVVCLQETKCDFFDQRSIRKFCPRRFDNFVYSPSMGASGGIIVLWCSSALVGALIDLQSYGIIINFSSAQNNQTWTLVNVYGPCQGELRDAFVHWLHHIQIPQDELWLFLGDFNFIRSMDTRNMPGGTLMICLFLMKSLAI